MAGIPIDKLRAYIANCDPSRPIDSVETEGWYVELDDEVGLRGRKGTSCISELYTRVLLSTPERPTCQLFTGFSGAGKTTELHRLKDRFEKDPEASFHVVFVDFDRFIDRYAPISITDVLRILAYELDREATRAEGKDPDGARGYLERFWGFLQSEVEFKNLDFERYGVSLMFEIRNNPSFRESVEKAIKLRFQEFATRAQDAMSEAVVRIRKATKRKQVLLIADSLEKMTAVRLEDRETIESSVEQVFLHHAPFLRLPCHAIYTFPLWLRHRTPGLANVYDGPPLALPMVKIAERTGGPSEKGIDRLVELVGRRIDVPAVFGADASALRFLVQMSGGYPKDLLRMVREVLVRFGLQNVPVTQADAETVVSDLVEEYRMTIREADLPILAEVARTRELPTSDGQLAGAWRLLDRWLLLTYRNGTEWYDVHPLAKRAPVVAAALAE